MASINQVRDEIAEEVGARLREECRQLSAKIGRLQAERRWVPVTERLPEKTGLYLVHLPSINDKTTYTRTLCYSVPHGWSETFTAVTHWMSLPLPPGAAKGEDHGPGM